MANAWSPAAYPPKRQRIFKPVFTAVMDRAWGLMMIRCHSPGHLVLRTQPHVTSINGVRSKIRFMFLLFPQVSRNWMCESEPPLKPLPLTCYSVERTRLSWWCLSNHKGCTYRAPVRYVTKTWSVVLLNKKKYIHSHLKCIVYDKLLKPRQSFLITLYSVGRAYSCWMLNLLVHHVTGRL
jgi:hypothetical protein